MNAHAYRLCLFFSVLSLGVFAPASGGDFPGGTYLENLEDVARWMQAHQNLNPLTNDYGGVTVDEQQNDYYQSDAGVAIFVWSRVKQRTGTTAFDNNIAAAWSFHSGLTVGTRGPQYQATVDSNGVIRGELAYREATGDSTYTSLANEHANWIINTRLDPTVRRNVICEGMASGAVYLFATDQGDANLATAAENIGNFVRTQIEADPTLLSDRSIEIHGSAAFSGVLESVFLNNFGDRQNWASTYGSLLPTSIPSGGFQYAFQAYLSGAYHAAWEATANANFLNQGLNLLAPMIAEDDDQDGGIPKNDVRPDNEDDAWTTGNLGRDNFEQLPDLDLAMSPDNVTVVAPGNIIFDFGAINHRNTVNIYYLVVFLKTPGGGQSFVTLLALGFPPNVPVVLPDVPLPVGAGTPVGRYELQVQAYAIDGTLLDSASFPYDVQ